MPPVFAALSEGPGVLLVTSNDFPGWEIQRVCGEVFGLTVRSRNAFSQMGAGRKAMFGDELAVLTGFTLTGS